MALPRALHHSECRNVLVRYCAHIPRNYQYKDGIQQVFLVLREHLGDENLDLAGGVLYELIEVDCEHTDDPGAAFQRWKHDHLRRYADLELPHVPHMTTITSSIIPTKRLTQWRSSHSDRYPFVLSDSSPSADRGSVDPSCIRNRKAWLIDHTLYISTRNDGTRPLNSPNPKEFHEMQWNHERGTPGKLVEERDVPIASLDCPSGTSPPGTADTLLNASSRCKGHRRSSSRSGLLEKLIDRIYMHRQEPEVSQRRRSWMPVTLMFETAASLRDKRTGPDIPAVPLPDGCQIPNAIFARKYLLVENSDSLPACLSLRQMPTAESKATDTIVEAATNGLLDNALPWSFRGPFTPQLGFDGGLDYQWSPREPNITIRRFDIDDSTQDITDISLDKSLKGDVSGVTGDYTTPRRTSTKRQGIIFNLDTLIDSNVYNTQLPTNYTISSVPTFNTVGTVIPRGLAGNIPLQPDESCAQSSRHASKLLASKQTELDNLERYNRGLRRKDHSLFRNVEFTVPAEVSCRDAPTSNRKTTVVELSSGHTSNAPSLEYHGGVR
ncbi:hypothetical protein F5Y04DRAFT_291949 [Hypomontagnella monticulosa]|nr:hypothetical protein F5Y04DRAFT_291949 [Hypomontagnella monticulosa]